MSPEWLIKIAFHDGGPLRQAQGELDVLHEQDRHAGRSVQRRDGVLDLQDDRGLDALGRLVHDEQPWARDQGSVDGELPSNAGKTSSDSSRAAGPRPRWRSMSPTRRPARLCALAIADDAYNDWELWLSEKLIGLAGRVLRDELGTQFRAAPFPAADVVGYEQELCEIAVHSGGNITEPQSRVFGLFGDSEDDKNVGSPAVTIGAQVVVAHESDVLNNGQRSLPMLGAKQRLVLFVTA